MCLVCVLVCVCEYVCMCAYTLWGGGFEVLLKLYDVE